MISQGFQETLSSWLSSIRVSDSNDMNLNFKSIMVLWLKWFTCRGNLWYTLLFKHWNLRTRQLVSLLSWVNRNARFLQIKLLSTNCIFHRTTHKMLTQKSMSVKFSSWKKSTVNSSNTFANDWMWKQASWPHHSSLYGNHIINVLYFWIYSSRAIPGSCCHLTQWKCLVVPVRKDILCTVFLLRLLV